MGLNSVFEQSIGSLGLFLHKFSHSLLSALESVVNGFLYSSFDKICNLTSQVLWERVKLRLRDELFELLRSTKGSCHTLTRLALRKLIDVSGSRWLDFELRLLSLDA